MQGDAVRRSGNDRASTTRKIRSAYYFRRNMYYYLLLAVPLVYFIVFRYGPIAGNLLAFRKIKIGSSLFEGEWVGLYYFKLFLNDPNFWTAFRNTWTLSLFHLAITFPLTLLFALLLNEVPWNRVKNWVQTVAIFPNFLSIVVVIGLMKELLSPTSGIINEMLGNWGIAPTYFMNEPGWFRTLYIASDIWQYTGWNAIIFVAALSAVDPQLYEAAELDGAGRIKQIFHVTIPQIMPTISVVFILSLGQLMNLGFEKVLLMYTPSNSQTSDIIDTFVFRIGMENSNYSYATAVGLFGGLVGLALVIVSNAISRRLSGYSLY